MRVLIVEDEALQRRAVAQLVAEMFPSAVVDQAADGLAAVELAEHAPPDAVFLDIRMPNMDGLSAARRIRAAAPSAALFVLTAYEHFEYAQQAVGLGIEEYLLKPAAPEDIERCLSRVELAVDARAAEAKRQAEVRGMLTEAMPLLAGQLVRDLCFGSINSPAEYRRRVSIFDLSGELELAITIGLGGSRAAVLPPARQAAATEAELELLRRQATARVEQEFRGYPGAVLVGRTRHDELTVLVEASRLRAAGRRPVEVTRRLLANVIAGCSEMDLPLVAGIGNPVASGISIWRSYRSAQRARERAALLAASGRRIIAARDLGDEVDQLLSYPLLAERGLAEVVRSGLTDQIDQYLPAVAGFFAGQAISSTQHGDASATRSRALECLAILARAASDGGAGPADQAHDLSTAAFNSALQALTGSGLAAVVSQLARDLTALVASSQEARQSGLATRAAALLEGHYPEEVTLTGVAQQLHVSSFYLSHVFRQAKGVTFSEYLTGLRIEEAKRLLAVTELPVVEVAARVGYREPNYFGRVFKRVTGVTPLAWRRTSQATKSG